MRKMTRAEQDEAYQLISDLQRTLASAISHLGVADEHTQRRSADVRKVGMDLITKPIPGK